MADGRIPTARRQHLIRELRPVVRSEAFDDVPDVGQNFRRCRGHVDGALAPEGVYPSHACHVILEPNQVQSRPKGRHGQRKRASGIGSSERKSPSAPTHAYSSPARTHCR